MASESESAGFAQLLTPVGWALLGGLPPYDEQRAMQLAQSMRDKGIDPDLAAAALTQSRLRHLARKKFSDFADGMLFTAAGLEQATRLDVATLHAQRYVRAGVKRVADLGCGIGSDSMAFASAGLSVEAIERDEVTAASATVNCRPFDVTVHHADAFDMDLDALNVDGIYADPARRTNTGKRVFDPKAYEPNLDEILQLRLTIPELGVKVAPGISHNAIPTDAEAQWVSVDGDVVEAGLWFGKLRRPEAAAAISETGTPLLSALVLRGTSAHQLDARQLEVESCQSEANMGAFFCEPDGAAIRAGLVADIAHDAGGWLLDPTIAYFTSNEPLPEELVPFATQYRVLDVMPFGLKRLKAYLRERSVSRITIKKRGTAVEPDQLRRQLMVGKNVGDNEATIALTRIAGEQYVIVLDPYT